MRLFSSRRLKLMHEKLDVHSESASWIPHGFVWARMKSTPLRLRLQAGVEEQKITHQLQFRKPSNVMSGDRLLLGARIYLVHFIHDPDGRGRWQECFCEERSQLS